MNLIFTEFNKIARELGPAFTGLNLVVGVALVARFLQGLIPGPILSRSISEILVAVILGLYIRNVVGVSPVLEPGIRFAVQRILRLGIILLGLRLSLQDVASTGVSALLLVAVCTTIALLLAYMAGRIFQIPPRLAILIGVGTAICGNSAIAATAPVIGAQDDDVSFAVGTITLFGLLAVISYPLIGQFLHLSDRVFGLWAGTAINDTSQVVAAGAAYSPLALSVATVVKLTRNTLMAPIIVLIGVTRQRTVPMAQDTAQTKVTFGKWIPWFVLGFLALSLLRTVGVASGILPQNVDKPGDLLAQAAILRLVDEVAKFAVLMALAGIGLGTNLQNLRKIGLKPFVVGLCVASVLTGVSLSLILITGLS